MPESLVKSNAFIKKVASEGLSAINGTLKFHDNIFSWHNTINQQLINEKQRFMSFIDTFLLLHELAWDFHN